MAKKQLVTKVWIEPGCIVCDACETAAPTVFEVLEDTCIIRPAAMTPDFTKPISEEIVDAAAECPVDVIKFETVEEEVPDEAGAPAPAEVAAAAPAAAASPAPVKEHKKAEPATAAAGKAPAAPAAAPAREAATAVAAKAPAPAHAKASMAGEPDQAIAALLRAATARGGNAVIMRNAEGLSEAAERWKGKDPSELPPDLRQARLLEAAKKVKQDPGQSRREFVGSAALALGWVAFGVGTGVSAGPAFLRFMMPNVLEEPDPRVRVGKLQRYIEMRPGDVIEDYKPLGIWMVREEDRIAALNIICTHLGCIPNWLPNDRKFKCPCHGSGYKPNGINFEGPTPRPLERFRLTIEDGILVVDKSKKYQQELGQWDTPGSFIAA